VAIELRFTSGLILEGLQHCESIEPTWGPNYLLDQISLVFIGRFDRVFQRSIPETGFNICLAVFLFRVNYFMSVFGLTTITLMVGPPSVLAARDLRTRPR